VKSLQVEFLAQFEKSLLVCITESRDWELSRGRTLLRELHRAEAAIPARN
jgi:hypothetical protein